MHFEYVTCYQFSLFQKIVNVAKCSCTVNNDSFIEFKCVEKGSNARTAYCKLCHHIFEISNIGRSAVTSHSKGKEYKAKEISRCSLPISFFSKKESDFVSLTDCPSASS